MHSHTLTASGREHHYGDRRCPTTPPRIDEIAHSLAQINRFVGHARRPYSVAEHSLLVADLARIEGAPPEVQLAALMHDAHEAYTGDVSTPVKRQLGAAWEAFEHAEATRLADALGLRTLMHTHRAAIKRWDLVALATERRDLTLFDPVDHLPWDSLDHPAHPVAPSEHLNHRLMHPHRAGWDWFGWKNLFISTYKMLRARVALADPLPDETAAHRAAGALERPAA